MSIPSASSPSPLFRGKVINDVTFAIGQGEVFGFLGPNGAGKTTTIRVLMALLKADSGTARIAGMDVWDQSVEIKVNLSGGGDPRRLG